MTERFPDFRTKHNSESHVRECSNRRCNNKINNKQPSGSECLSCLERKDIQMVTALANIKKYKTDIAVIKKTQERLQGIIDTHTKEIGLLEKSPDFIEDIKKQVAILTPKIDYLETALLQEQMKVKYKNDLVSNDHKYYDGIATNGKEWTLETHCTIVRVEDSVEDVFFGHVTLIISKNEDSKIFYKWHYGIETFPFNLPNLPKDSKNEFWQYRNKSLHPDSTEVSHFAKFRGIPDNTFLSDIMKYHLDKCVTSFRKRTQWENQVWKPTDIIDGENAPSLIDRLNKIHKYRETHDPQYSKLVLEQLSKDIKQKEDQRQKRIDERQEAEAAAKKAEAAAKKADIKGLFDPTKPLSEAEKARNAADLLKWRTDWEKDIRERRASDKIYKEKQDAINIAALVAKQQKDREAKKADDEKKARAESIKVGREYQKGEKSRALQQNAEKIQKKTAEDALELERTLKERITQAKIYVDKLLQDIRGAIENIKSMKNDIENKEKNELYLWSKASFKDRYNLMKECNKFISYIEKNMETFEKEIDLLQDEPLKIEIYKYKFTVLDFKNSVYRSNLEDMEKWESIYNKTIVPKEKLLKSAEYRLNPEHLDDIKHLFYFYKEYMDISANFMASLDENKGLLTKEDYTNMRKYISSINKTIKPEKRYISTQFFMNLLIVKRYYITSISPIEEQLKDIRYRRNNKSLTDISELIHFYRDYYEQAFVQEILNQINYDDVEEEYVIMIKKDIKHINQIVNHKESLARSQISMKILEYNFEIKDKEEKLLTLYRQDHKAIVIMKKLIPFYIEYLNQLKEWNSSLSNLQEKDGYMIEDILYLKSLIQNPEQFLEILYMMHGHNLIELYAKVSDDKDESEEQILENFKIINLDEKEKRAEVLTGLIKTIKAKGPYSTKKAIIQFKLGTNKLEERIKLLKEDANKLIGLLEQEKGDIETQLEDDHLTEEATLLRKELRNIYIKYRYFTMNLISHIKEKIKDEDSILDLLYKFLEEIESSILYLDYNDANKSLYEMEEYYNQYIVPKVRLISTSNLSSDELNILRAYYQSFEFDMTALVKHKIEKLNPTDTLTENINLRIKTLEDNVNSIDNLRILKRIQPRDPDPDPDPDVTKDQTQSLYERKSLIEHYNFFPDDENEEDETIIRNFLIFQPHIKSYPIAKDFVTHIKNFRDKMYEEKTFSTKYLLKYYGYCL